MTSATITGTWKLISADAKSQNNDSVQPYGENPYGRLMYDKDGNMSVILMRRGRSKFISDDIYGGSTEEIKEAFEGFDAYCGTYEVDIKNGVVTHNIEGARFPNWEGTDQQRFFELSDGRLVLKTAPIPGLGTEWVVSLIWHRIA